MRLTAEWLSHPGTRALCAALEGAGHRALFVGGAVRNALLDEPVDDIDLSTDALPKQVMQLAEAAGLKVVPTGLAHGTVTVVASGKPHEVTTFRKDIETDGRRAVVAFSPRVEDDAMRRDFTMNALYCDQRGQVIDPTGEGLADLARRRFRFIGVAEDRIREDYLRILRFFRFHARYGDHDAGFDAKGLAACAALADGMAQLSRERVGAEMKKLLAAPDPAPALASMAQTGVLAQVLQGAAPEVVALLVHLEAGRAPDAMRRLAALGGTAPGEALRLSKAEAKRVERLREAASGAASPGALGYRLGAGEAENALLLRAAFLEAPLDPQTLVAAREGAAQSLPVKAADFVAKGLQGPEIGAAMQEAEARWIASGFALGRNDLLA